MRKIFHILAVLVWVALLFPYPSAVFLAGCFGCFSYPAYRKLHARWPDVRAVAAYAACLTTAIAMLISLFILLVIPQARAGFYMLKRLRATNFQLPQHWLDTLDDFQARFSFIPGLDEWIQDIGTNLESALGDVVMMIVSGGFNFLGGTMQVLWQLFLFVTFTSLSVMYADRFRIIVKDLCRIGDDILDRFIAAIRGALRGVFMGVLLVALAQGLVCGIGFSVAGVSQPAFWGLLATFVAPIPVVGSSLIWGPLCIMLWFSGSMWSAIGLALWGLIVVAGVDTVLRPLFLRQGINAPLFVLVLSILCGLATFGSVGLVLGPVLVAFAIQAVREADYLSARPAARAVSAAGAPAGENRQKEQSGGTGMS